MRQHLTEWHRDWVPFIRISPVIHANIVAATGDFFSIIVTIYYKNIATAKSPYKTLQSITKTKFAITKEGQVNTCVHRQTSWNKNRHLKENPYCARSNTSCHTTSKSSNCTTCSNTLHFNTWNHCQRLQQRIRQSYRANRYYMLYCSTCCTTYLTASRNNALRGLSVHAPFDVQTKESSCLQQ